MTTTVCSDPARRARTRHERARDLETICFQATPRTLTGLGVLRVDADFLDEHQGAAPGACLCCPRMGSGISEFLTADHRRSEELFEAAVQRAAGGDWDGCREQFGAFRAALHRHLDIEEQILFPAFEETTGITAGPTLVMRHEHQQMLQLLDRLSAALAARDAPGFSNSAKSFAGLMAAHSTKEENVLYPMCDEALSKGQSEKLQAMVKEA